MKKQLIALTVSLISICSQAEPLTVSFKDSAWDGKAVPDMAQCNKFDGTLGSPELTVSNIPEGSNALIVAFSDKDYPPADNGGHGIIATPIPLGSQTYEIKSVPAHSFELPTPFVMMAEHKASFWDTSGAYLPPCSGGMGNRYYLTVLAVNSADSINADSKYDVLGQFDLQMGTY